MKKSPPTPARFHAFICGLAVFGLMRLEAVLFENWDDPNVQANSWFYFNEADEADHGNVLLDWHAAGGIGNSPHVSCPLGNLTNWMPQTPADAFFPLYGIDPHHSVNLMENPLVRIAVRDMDNVNLAGGALFFWVGQWIEEDEYHFVYFNPFSFVPSATWRTHVIETTPEAADWTVLGSMGPVPDLVTLLSDPQQFGFTIRGGMAEPAGRLGFDDLSIIPEPASLIFATGLAALLFAWRCRQRQTTK